MRIVKKLVIAVLAVASVGALIVAVRLNSMSHRRAAAVREYEAQGFQMVKFCNGSAANGAHGEVYAIQERLEDFADSPGVDTNVIVQLKNALAIAKEKERVLSDDCARRGHCHTYPWKTNWAIIKEALTASEKLYH